MEIIYFDSKPEMYYYFWLLDNGIEFEYNKKYYKKYLQKDGKLHPYYFDFHILSNDTYVELKGDCFFNENDEPIGVAPYKGYDWTEKYNIVGRELSESTNACGGPRSSVKQESSKSSSKLK